MTPAQEQPGSPIHATPRIFRVVVEVSNLDDAAAYYGQLLGDPGKRHPGSRHYFDCGGVTLALLDPSPGGRAPTPGPKALYFAVHDIAAVHARARSLQSTSGSSQNRVHGQPAEDIVVRPWGERSFYLKDPWGNELCFVQEGTLYT